MSKRPTPAERRRAVQEWNRSNGAETRVRYWLGLRQGPGQLGTTSTQAQVLGGHTAGVYITGAGFVGLTHVEAIEP